MNNSNLIINKIKSFYTKKNNKIIIPYETLCDNHLKMINLLKDFWIDVKINKPKNKESVLGLEDLSNIGKGKFVCEFFYERNTFVANLGDCDPYGYITHWISIDKLNKSNINFEKEISQVYL